MGDDAAVQKALSDPKFLAFGPEDQVAILKHLGSQPSAPTEKSPEEQALEAGGLPLPPKAAPSKPEPVIVQRGRFRSPPLTTGGADEGKFGRGLALGAAHGLGIEPENATESSSGTQVVAGAIRHTLQGMGTAADAIIHDPIEGTYKVIDNMASQLENSLRESWTGMMSSDPEQFAHGFASAVTQAITLGSAGKGEAAAVSKRARLARIAKGINAGGEEAANLKTAMPVIVETAKGAGLKTVGEFGDAVGKAHSAVENEFNAALAPVAKKPYLPTEIATSIRNLVTPDMLKDYRMIENAKQSAQKAGLKNPKFKFSDNAWKTHDAVVEIQRQAHEFERPWTVEELNARRMTENDNLSQSGFYNKDTRGQAAAMTKTQTDISQAVVNGTRDIVYDQVSKANPQLDARALKAKQAALWQLDDYINHPKKGIIADLEAKQLQHEGESRVEKLTTGASVGRTGVPHGYIGGLSKMFSEGPMKAADAKVKGAFEPSFTRKAAKAWALSLPLTQLMRTPQRPGSLPLPPSSSATDEK